MSDFTDSFSSLQECFRQLNVPLEETKEESKTVYHAYDAVEKTNFTFVVPPNHLKRDLFFALELAKAVDIMMFAVDAGTANGLTGIIDEVCTCFVVQYILCFIVNVHHNYRRV